MDGSLTIYLARQLPAGVPYANWLPIPKGPFDIMLRVHGPQGKVAHNIYVPPAIGSDTLAVAEKDCGPADFDRVATE